MSSDGVKFLDLGSVYKGLVECSGDMETYVIDADEWAGCFACPSWVVDVELEFALVRS